MPIIRACGGPIHGGVAGHYTAVCFVCARDRGRMSVKRVLNVLFLESYCLPRVPIKIRKSLCCFVNFN